MGRALLDASQLVAAEAAPLEVRQAASVNFKNHVKTHWEGRSADDMGGAAMPATPEAEKVHHEHAPTPQTLRDSLRRE